MYIKVLSTALNPSKPRPGSNAWGGDAPHKARFTAQGSGFRV